MADGLCLTYRACYAATMDGLQLIASTLCGGLAGASVSTISNRMAHRRAIRTLFHPELNNVMGAYAIRFINPEGRYRTFHIGYAPSPEDTQFVDHRTEFVMNLPRFNELKEARDLRRVLITPRHPGGEMGTEVTMDYLPEYQAILKCLGTVQKKLGLE
jgi:hypothetical protein